MRRLVFGGGAALALVAAILVGLRLWQETGENAVPAARDGRSSPRSSDFEGLAALGVAQRHAGEYGKAVVSLRGCLELSPEDSARRERIRFELALALAKQDRPRDAALELVELLLENPYSRKAYVQLGQCLSRLGRLRAAEGLFELARKLSRGEAESRRAADFLAAGRPELAARYRARSFVLMGRFEAAERVFGEAAAIESPGVRIYLAEYLLETLQVQKARGVLRALEPVLGSSHPDLRGWAAIALKHEGRAGEAAAILAELCRDLPQLTPVWAPEVARILLEDLARPAEALGWLELYLERHESAEARILLARALLGAGETEEAVEVLRATPSQTHAWEEQAGDVWLALGRVRLGEDLEEVGEALRENSARRRHLPEYHLALAEWVAATKGDHGGEDPREEAHRLSALKAEFTALRLRAATSPEPDVAAHLCSAAEVLWTMGDRERAIRFARIAASVDPDRARPWRLLEGWLGRPEEVFLRAEARRRRSGGSAGETATSVLEEIVAGPPGGEGR